MKPVLLLIPGMLNDATLWDEVAAEVAPLAPVRIAAPVQASIAEMAQAAWALLADVSPAQPVVIAGFSLGGYVALEMLAHPLRAVRAAALMSTSARPDTPEGAAGRAKTLAAMQRDFAKTVDGIVQWNTCEPPPALVERLAAMMRRVGAETAARQMHAIAGRADHRDTLARLALPVAVLCGRHDRTTPPPLSEEIARLVPGAHCEIVEGAAHMLPVEQPQAVVRSLRSLLL
ncbi:MAG: alpha/beta fold hydrolase [Variovorax sp.]|nr:alpha/beta fold hydrolase [Variovorax sp.]